VIKSSVVKWAGYVVLINKKCEPNLQSERLKGKPRMEGPGLDGRTLNCSSKRYAMEDMDSMHVAKDSVKGRIFQAREWTFAFLKS